MALSIGELVGYVDLDQTGWNRGLDAAGKSLGNLQTTATRALASVEQDAAKRLDQVAGHLGNAFDPTRAIADIDRLVAEFARDVDRMEAEAGRGGEGIVEQLRRHLGEAEDVARRSGEDAGRGFSDGLGDGGKSRLGGIGEGFMSTLKGLGWAAAGAAIGKLISDGIGAALDLDAARAKLQARVGDPALVAEIGKAAGAVYGRGFTESLDEATEAAQAVLSTGLVPKGDAAALEDLTVKVQAYAKAWGDDVADAVQYASTLVGSGLAKDATHALDLITEASRRVPTALREDVLEAGDEYSQFFRALGFSGEQAFGLLVKAAEKGKYGIDKTGDAIKEFTLRATTMDAATKDAYQAIGLNAEKMSNALLKGGDTAQAAFRKIVDGLMSIKDPTEQANTAIALFGTPLEDLNKADIPAFLANLDKVGAGLGDVSGAAKATGDALENSASQKLQAFKNSLQQNVVDFLGNTVLPAVQGFWSSLTEGDVGGKLSSLGSTVASAFSGIAGDVAEWVDKNRDKIQELKQKFDDVFGGIVGVVQEAVGFVKAIWDRWGDEIMTGTTTVLGQVQSTISGAFETIKGIFQTATGIITGDWSKTWEGIKSIFSGATANIRNIADSLMSWLMEKFGLSWSDMKKRAEENLKAIGDRLSKFGSDAKKALSDAGTWLVQTGKDMIQGLINGIKSMAGNLVESAKGVVQSAIDGAKALLGIHSPSKVFAEIGSYSMQGLAQGILGGSTAVDAAMAAVVKTVTAKAAQALQLSAGVGGKLPAGIGALPAGPASSSPVAITAVTPNDYAGAGGVYALGSGYGSGGVVVHMPNAVIREQADIGRLGAEFAFQYRSRG